MEKRFNIDNGHIIIDKNVFDRLVKVKTGKANILFDVVPFIEEDVKEYLDSCIGHWRVKKKSAEERLSKKNIPTYNVRENLTMASYYIDAFQSVRMSLFGELLPADGD